VYAGRRSLFLSAFQKAKASGEKMSYYNQPPQYGNPYGGPNYNAPAGYPQQGATQQGETLIRMPNTADMGGQDPGVPPWVRYPFFPTAPYYSTNPAVGYQTRYYSTGLLPTDSDYAVGTEAQRIVTFDLPVRIIAINAAVYNTVALVSGMSGLDTFLLNLTYSTGDKLTTAARLASTVAGTGQRPGELGGSGVTIDQGSSLVVGITPIIALAGVSRIDVTIHCLEMRGQSNYLAGPPRR
jgi:hypothetical protein